MTLPKIRVFKSRYADFNLELAARVAAEVERDYHELNLKIDWDKCCWIIPSNHAHHCLLCKRPNDLRAGIKVLTMPVEGGTVLLMGYGRILAQVEDLAFIA
jgi:hypothetical protein